MTLPDFYKGYHKEGAAMRKKTKVKNTKGGQMQKLSNEKYKFRSPRPESWTGPIQQTDKFNNAFNFKQKTSELMSGVRGPVRYEKLFDFSKI